MNQSCRFLFLNSVLKFLFLLCIMIIATPFSIFGQPTSHDPDSTEIVVIGTVHKETSSYTSRDLASILQRVHPDVILVEYDSTFFDKNNCFKKIFDGLEQSAILLYRNHNSVELRPYDIEGRNAHYKKSKTFELEDEFFRTLDKMRKDKSLDPYSTCILNQISICMAKRDIFMKMTPRHINSFTCDRNIAEKTYAMDFGYSEIISRNPLLSRFSEFWNNSTAFEDTRNDAMVGNILKYANEFHGKRIVVLCGFEHRHRLRYDLRISKDNSIKLIEYWEYSHCCNASKETIKAIH